MNSDIWIAFLSTVAAAFGVLEGLGFEKPGGTLSETTRRWLGVSPHKPRRKVAVPLFTGGLAMFLAWFIPHILMGG